MNRCLHITVHEGLETRPRQPAMSLPGRPGSPSGTGFPDDPRNDPLMARTDDPGNDPLMARTDDPGNDPLMARTDDPETDHFMPRTENPGYTFPSGGSGGWGAVTATAGSCGCAPACRYTKAAETPHPCGSPHHSGFVIVRLAPGIESENQSLWHLAYHHEPQLTGLLAVLELPVKARNKRWRIWHLFKPLQPPDGTLASRPLIALLGRCGNPMPDCQSRKQIRELEKQTAYSDFPPLHSLTSYWRLDLRHHPDLVDEVVARLNGLAAVGLAYRELAATDPAEVANGSVFSEDQGYLGDAPMGIGASWAQTKVTPLEPPKKVTLCDLEQGWNLKHQALVGQVPAPLFGVNRAQPDGSLGHHGTAVLGQLVAANSPFGLKGIAADVCTVVVASHYTEGGANGNSNDNSNGHVAAAITQALTSPLKRGDILLIEVQRGLLPVEADEADLDAIRLAAGLDIIVIEAAGNGGFDLDAYSNPCTGRSLRRGDSRFRDSGAILVGAARAGLPHDRAPFSNYGSRVDCFGWGEGVTTCGYGNLTGKDVTDSYTNSFSGTSSASPMIAGAAALLQHLHLAHSAGGRLEPLVMREILSDPATGTRQGPNVPGHIGVMPDLKAILRDRLQLVPNVYLRRSIGDDGSSPAPTDEISSSPDIFVSSLDLDTMISRFGAGSGRENLAAPGDPVVPGDIYLRLRNRGSGAGTVRVQVFASPAATLLTPERWFPVSQPGLEVGPVPQGDTLSMAGPVSWITGLNAPTNSPAWSLLAILSEPEKRQPDPPPYFDATYGMPPGPPYFDWAEYRAFLRSPGVAWRNTHQAVAGSPMHFAIAGTPDLARHFDFELLQQLPDDATVTLKVPMALNAKLQGSLKWGINSQGSLDLPKGPLTVVRGIKLATGAWIKAFFTVTTGGSPLIAGDSLAVRQLWRGEEVGRITWFFGPRSY